jgi:hypothetical protein
MKLQVLFSVNASLICTFSGESTVDALNSSFQTLFDKHNIRSNVGVGLVVRAMGVKFELNYNVPVTTFATDKVKTWQFGFSATID